MTCEPEVWAADHRRSLLMFPDLNPVDMSDLEGMQETVSRLRTGNRIEMLALMKNRVLKMSMTEPYADNPEAMKVFMDMKGFLDSLLDEELIHLGDSVQWSYGEDLMKKDDRRTVGEVELEYLRTHCPRVSESEKTIKS